MMSLRRQDDVVMGVDRDRGGEYNPNSPKKQTVNKSVARPFQTLLPRQPPGTRA
jgi:hypothetical protein